MASFDFVDEYGVIVADTSSTRADVETAFRGAFGQDIDVDPSTATGVLISMFTELIDKVARNNAELASQINPDHAGGIFLDALMGLNGIERIAAEKSIINGVVMSGVPGAVVPAGSLARTTSGEVFELISTTTLTGGQATGSFRAIEEGPIEVEVGQLERVASSVLGWETVHNPLPAELGRNEETDPQARRRRLEGLASQSVDTFASAKAAIWALPGVSSVCVLENRTPETKTIKGVNVARRSLYFCVEGGADNDIAETILHNTTAVWLSHGSVTVSVAHGVAGVYPVTFDRPREVEVLIRVKLSPQTMIYAADAKQAVLDYVAGLVEGDHSYHIGVDVSPWEIAGAINQRVPAANVRQVSLRRGMGSWQDSPVFIAADEIAKTTSTAVTIMGA